MSLRIPDFSSVKALVAGDLMLDRYWLGSASRISPEAPVPVVRITQSQTRAGGAANVAVNLASLGARTALAGVIGRDADGGALRQLLGEQGIELDLVESDGCPTITKLRVLSRSVHGASVCVLSDYAKGSLGRAAQLVQSARNHGVPVLVDPKGTDFSRYRGATALTPNLAEFEAVAGAVTSDEELLARGRRLR
ncbi:MAG: PfkB family carbohydrate kinase, partial [Gammaproteobacteria bacterium]|nr:PfkB family carbohydrate kinase [Gammaproteobacteria bacterium]